MKYLFAISLLLSCYLVHAQLTPSIIWQKSVGGNSSDVCVDMVYAADGRIYLSGSTSSNNWDVRYLKGSRSYWVTCFDTIGYLNWAKCYGGDKYSYGNSIGINGDGFIVAGQISAGGGDVSKYNGSNDFWAFKIDNTGNIIWDKTYGGKGYESYNVGCSTPDGGFIHGGTTYSSDGDIDTAKKIGYGGAWLLKTDSIGDIEWQTFLGDSNTTVSIYGITPLSDGGYAVTGFTRDSFDVMVAKLDKTGIQEWTVHYGGDSLEYAYDIKETKDGGYILVGYTKSSNRDVDTNYGDKDIWVLKLDKNGALEWQKNYGGSREDIGSEVIECIEGGYLFIGTAYSSDVDVVGNKNTLGSSDIWLVKIDGQGNIEWQKCLGGLNNETGRRVIQLHEGSFVVCGNAESWTGDLNSNYGLFDTWVLRLSNPNIVGVNTAMKEDNSIKIFPNPANEQITIKLDNAAKGILQLVAMNGQTITSIATDDDTHNYTLDTRTVHTGNYLIRLEMNGVVRTKKVSITH